MFRVDDHIGTLVAGLSERGHAIDKDTIIMVIGDHGSGINMPEHHGQYHGRLLYESSVLVPWVVAGPGIPEGAVVPSPSP